MKATVIFDKQPVKVDFINAGLDRVTGELVDTHVLGALIIFNAIEKILVKDQEDANRKKLIEGLGAEISLSYTYGWINMYYCSFPKFKDISSVDIPIDFMSTNEDLFCSKNKLNQIYEYIDKNKDTMKKLRFVGIIAKNELEQIAEKIKEIKPSLILETDSPYLILV